MLRGRADGGPRTRRPRVGLAAGQPLPLGAAAAAAGRLGRVDAAAAGRGRGGGGGGRASGAWTRALKWPNDVLVGRAQAGRHPGRGRRRRRRASTAVGGRRRRERRARPGRCPTALRDARRRRYGARPRARTAARSRPRSWRDWRVWYHAPRSRGRARACCAAWRARSVPWWGRAGRGAVGRRRSCAAIARDIDERGALLLRRPTAARASRVVSGDVRELRLADASAAADP